MVDSTTARQHQADRGQLVELRQQDREDQEDRGAEGLDQEGAGLGALLVLALELEGDARAEIGLAPARAVISCCTLAVCTPSATLDGHRHDAIAVDAVDVADALRRHALHEIADRHVAGSRSARAVRRSGRGCGGRAGSAPGYRPPCRCPTGRYSVTLTPLVTSCTAVPTVFDAGAVFRGLRLVDLDLPVDAGQRQAVVEIADVAALPQGSPATFLAAAGSTSGSSAPSCTWIGLPVGGPARGAVTSTRMPGMSAVLARIASMISCAGGRVLPVGELELDHADRVLGDLARCRAAARRRGYRRS